MNTPATHPSRSLRPILALFLGTGALSAQQTLQSTFMTDTEGWTHVGAAAFSQNPAGGNPGGYLHIDNSEGPVTFIFAPAALLGDLRAFDGGTIAFDGNMLGIGGAPWTSAGQDYGHLRISSPAGVRTVDLVPAPGQPLNGVWTTYSVPLDVATWGGTQDTWTSILANVTEMRLSVEAMFGAEIQGIDNFKLTTRPEAPWSVLCNGSGVNPVILRDTSATAPAPTPSYNAPTIGKRWQLELDCSTSGLVGAPVIFRLGFGPKVTPFSSPYASGEVLVPLGAANGQNFAVLLPANQMAKLGPMLIPNSTILIGTQYTAQARCPALPTGYLSNGLFEIVGN
jgi:hypothetical protein